MKKIKSGIIFALLMFSAFSVFGFGIKKNKNAVEEVVVEKTRNLIPNGEFNKNSTGFDVYKESLGSADLGWDAQKKCLKCYVKSVGYKGHSIQVFVDGFSLSKGVEYQFSFDIWSDMEREIEWRIQINGKDYHAYVGDYIPIGAEVNHVKVNFTMEEPSDPAPRLVFNTGLVEPMKDAGLKYEKVAPHTIYFDNINLEIADDSAAIIDENVVEIPLIRINQCGYLPESKKYAMFADLDEEDVTYSLVEEKSGATVKAGKFPFAEKSEETGEIYYLLDFSEIKTPGTYKLVTNTGKESYSFEIGKNVYKKLYDDVFKMLYLQRCGTQLEKDAAGDFAHDICHDSLANVYGSSKKLDVSGGWHDAGDYGRYVVSGAKALADLLLAYRKTGNEVLLTEAEYELNWLLKMQDENGGVYHKVTCNNFPGVVLPEDETEPLILSPISNTATGDFAAITAMASEIYKTLNPEYSEVLKNAAIKAYDYLLLHKNEGGFKNPETITTGEYPDDNCDDELFWASVELYKLTGDEKYFTTIECGYGWLGNITDLGWGNMAGYGVYDALKCEKLAKNHKAFVKEMKKEYLRQVNEMIKVAKENPYKISRSGSYEWGSNMGIANTGMTYLLANEISPDKKYVEYANYSLNYLLGINATGYCFVTGSGILSPENPHHRPSQVVEKTMPGMLVGGVNSNLDDSYARAVLREKAPAKCYVDNVQSYSCNEICVYWNSPLIALMDMLM